MSQKCYDDCKVHYKLAMGGAPQGAMRIASQIWQVVFASQTLQVFCLAFRKKAQYVVVHTGLHKTHTRWLVRSWNTFGAKTNHGQHEHIKLTIARTWGKPPPSPL